MADYGPDYSPADYDGLTVETFNSVTTILKSTDIAVLNSVTTILREAGAQSYYFDLRDSTDTQVATGTGTPPTTVFTDEFTGLGDGTYSLYVRSVQKYKNLENTIDETWVKFRLASGLIEPLLPNLPLSVSATMLVDAGARISWNYSPTNEETPPTTFKVYSGAVLVDTVTYTGATSYSSTLLAQPEVSTVFGVSSLAGTDETAKVTATATPDGTPPVTVPFTFEVK